MSPPCRGIWSGLVHRVDVVDGRLALRASTHRRGGATLHRGQSRRFEVSRAKGRTCAPQGQVPFTY